MSLPKIGKDFPDEWDDLIQALELSSALSDQLGDHINKRLHQNGINQYDIMPVDPMDQMLKDFQTEMLRLKEDNRILSNAIRSADHTNKLLMKYLTECGKKIKHLEATKSDKRKSR